MDTAQLMWERFMAQLNTTQPIVFKKADGPVPHMAFLGSVEHYRKIFMAANAGQNLSEG